MTDKCVIEELFRQQPKFEVNEINKEFTEFLFTKGFVGKHKIKDNRIIVTTVDLSILIVLYK